MNHLQELRHLSISQEIQDIFMNRIFDPMDAVIFDIDDTVIDSLGEPIPAIIALTKFFRFKGAAIFFITARVGEDFVRKHTEAQMQKLNISYNAIYYRHNFYDNPWTFKRDVRCMLSSQYRIILSIGDKPWDIGECGGMSILLN